MHCGLAFSVAMIGLLIMMLCLEVDAQSTVDDGSLCQATSLEEVVNSIRRDIDDIKLMNSASCQFICSCDVTAIKEDLTEVKTLLRSRQQPSNHMPSTRQLYVSAKLIRFSFAYTGIDRVSYCEPNKTHTVREANFARLCFSS